MAEPAARKRAASPLEAAERSKRHKSEDPPSAPIKRATHTTSTLDITQINSTRNVTQSTLFETSTSAGPLDTTTTHATRNTAVNLPRSAVFDTTELFESILIRLPFQDLFVLQRVCQEWRDVIAASVLLQQRMFLRSGVPQESWTLRSLTNWPAYYLDNGSPEWYEGDVELVPTSKDTTNNIKKLVPVALCPLAEVNDSYVSATYGLQNTVEDCSLYLGDLQGFPGTWRRMLVTDPPSYELTFTGSLTLHRQRGSYDIPRHFGFSTKVRDADGVKLGGIFDAVLDASMQRLYVSNQIDVIWYTGLKEVLAEAFANHGKESAYVKHFKVRIDLPGMVVPTEEEWKEFRRKAME